MNKRAMQRTSSRKLRIKLTCRAMKNDGTTKTTCKWKKSSLIAWAQVHPFVSAYLKVEYEPGYYNTITVDSLEELKAYLALFTEKELLDFIENTRQ